MPLTTDVVVTKLNVEQIYARLMRLVLQFKHAILFTFHLDVSPVGTLYGQC